MLRELESRHEAVQFRYLDFYDGTNRPLLERYAVRGHPSTVFLNGDGSVASRLSGLVRPSAYVGAIQGLR